MKTILCRIAVLGVLYPYIVGFAPDSSNTSITEFGFAVGHGSYAKVRRDCSGNIVSVEDIPYTDGGVSIDHRFSVFRVGAKAGAVGVGGSESDASLFYVNPDLGLNTKYFGLDVGAFAGSMKGGTGIIGAFAGSMEGGTVIIPSGTLRLGNKESWYFSLGLANNLPISTGGGLVDLGLGFNLGKPNSNLWLGMGGLPPRESAAFSVKADIPYSDDFVITLRGHATGKNIFEYGLSVGGKVVF